jgi:hypothetical protein
MGLTWIFGVLIVEEEALIPLTYIYTILVAFQGVFIFVIFVIFSKQSREAYEKWWRVKVNQSDFLNRLFGNKSLSSRKTVSFWIHSCLANCFLPYVQTISNGTANTTSKTSIQLEEVKTSEKKRLFSKSLHS